MQNIPTCKLTFRTSRRGAGDLRTLEVFFLILNLTFFGIVARKWLTKRTPGDLFNVGLETSSGLDNRKSGNSNFLMLGVDEVEGTHRTDTIILMGLVPAERKISVLSIPRDTRVIVDGRSRKINEILARYGEYALRSLIEDLMQIRIKRIIKIGFEGFVNIVDMIGGVDIDIEKSMHYDDNYGNVHIHFDKGHSHLDGRKALDYVRFRADATADLGRIKRQQQFINHLISKLSTPASIARIPQIIREVFEHIHTDLNIAELLDIYHVFRDGRISVETMSLPGEAKYIDKASYFIPYKDQAVLLGSKYFSDLMLMEFIATFTAQAVLPVER